MNGSRKSISPIGAGLRTAGVAVGLATVLGAAAAPAHAAPPPPKPDGTRVTAVAGADGALTLRVSPTAKPAPAPAQRPTTSPRVERVYIGAGGSTPCPSGYVCPVVPYGSGAYVFKMYKYGTYHLSYWQGVGELNNNQTGGAAARYDNADGGQIGCVPARTDRNVNWTPVWRIRVTESGC